MPSCAPSDQRQSAAEGNSVGSAIAFVGYAFGGVGVSRNREDERPIGGSASPKRMANRTPAARNVRQSAVYLPTRGGQRVPPVDLLKAASEPQIPTSVRLRQQSSFHSLQQPA